MARQIRQELLQQSIIMTDPTTNEKITVNNVRVRPIIDYTDTQYNGDIRGRYFVYVDATNPLFEQVVNLFNAGCIVEYTDEFNKSITLRGSTLDYPTTESKIHHLRGVLT